MKKEIKNIELTIDDVRNVKKISFVNSPAMEGEDFMYFHTDECFQKVDQELGIVTGLLMRPNKLIPRIDKTDGSEYTVSFSEETVRLASELYLKDGNQKESNLEHAYNIEGACLVESYIITDPKVNNAVALGFKDVQKGDWWGSLKVTNEDLKKMIKSGMVKGFSIEGQFVDVMVNAKEEQEKLNKCCDHDDIINQMIECSHDFDKLSNLVENYLGFTKYPPYHLDCNCRLVDGKIVTHPENSNSGTCDYCLEKQREWNSK